MDFSEETAEPAWYPIEPHQPPTLADVVRAEQAQVAAGTPGCGHVCPEHQLTCVRAAHPHDADADMGPGQAKGNVVPHVAQNIDPQTRQPDGTLAQWVCSPPCPPVPAPPAAGQLAQ